ncbi:MAG: DNA-binding response regulator [Cytophagaceae bacterium]|nr:DNA-binding response regulator [Cytophagaceae bacterium]|tara:strand:- start:2050 stop:2727 length:678 start_codon:yes stop_codon:yes gene_type:complete
MKILIVEDEPQLLQSIQDSLERESFLVETATDFHTAIEKVFVYEYDCILLDIMLPNGSGFDILSELKKAKRTENIIIISAKDSLDDRVKGLQEGADDYLVKPFHLAELNARVKAVLRRKKLDGRNMVEIGNTILDLSLRECEISGNPVALNRKEFDILNYFMLNINRLVTKAALAEHVWGDFMDQADNFDFVYYQIKHLRKKLRDSMASLEIESIYGVGYKMVKK